MSKPKLEQRVAELEKQFSDLLAELAVRTQQKDWRRTYGAFTGDDVMKQIFEEGAKIRKEETKRAQRRGQKKPSANS